MAHTNYSSTFTLSLLSILAALPTQASQPAHLFHKCYSHITGTRPAADHPLLIQVLTGQMSPIEACTDVLNSAQLNSSGISLGEASGDPRRITEAQNILRTFHSFHRTWFAQDSFNEATAIYAETGEQDLFDHSEAANHVSWLLFSADQEYRTLLRGKRSIRAIRESAPSVGRITNRPTSDFLHNFRNPQPPTHPCDLGGPGYEDDFQNCAPPEPLNPTLLETGKLRGFRPLSPSEMQQEAIVASSLYSFTSRHRIKYQEPKGGGALGSASYLILNMGLGFPFPKSNGGNRVPRRLINVALDEFACRKTPVISPEDAEPYVRITGPHPWQPSSSCMSCHATLDGGAGAFRNFSFTTAYGFTVPIESGYPIDHIQVLTHPTVIENSVSKISSASLNYLPQESDLYGIISDSNFHNRPPKGRFIMRNYRGELVNKEILGIDEFGVELSEIDDFYVCAASRYFGFLTGFTPPLLAVPTTSQREIEARDEVIKWGQELKQSQNLRSLIRSIIESPLYQEGLDP